MSSAHFLLIAILVFALMFIGIVLTIKEFKSELNKEKEANKNTNSQHSDLR